MNTAVYEFHEGTLPLLVSIPHLGTGIPDEQRAQLTQIAGQVADTDWHLDTLYDFARSAGASVLGGRISRYVIDLNRPSSGESLYPGQTTTGLCPTETFRGEPLYRNGAGPSEADKAQRLERYWRPYHQKLQQELERLRGIHGRVLLWEAHSIASVLPRLFEGKLPDLNLGTHSGLSCDPRVMEAVIASLADQPFTWVHNGRFKGGFITRQYGRPEHGVHAIQLEMCQSTYMNEAPPFEYRPDLAARVKPVVHGMIDAALGALMNL